MIGKIVAQLRKERGWTQVEYGAKCGLGQSYVSMIESGSLRPSFEMVTSLARGLEMPRHELVRLVDEAEQAAAATV